MLCDTNGGMLPTWMGDVVSAAVEIGVDIGVHCHNDSGCAVANTLAAVEAGAMHVQGTINGYGERTGNMDLTTLIADLQLKYGWPLLSPEQLSQLTRISFAIADIANQPHIARQPYVGHSAFAHKAGLHASAIKVNEDLYQHTRPDYVGNDMRMLISNMAGRASVQIKGGQLGLDLTDREMAGRITDAIKEREAQYSYEAADVLRTVGESMTQQVAVRADRMAGLHRKIVNRTNSDNSEATVKLVARANGRASSVRQWAVNALGGADPTLCRPIHRSPTRLTDARRISMRTRPCDGARADRRQRGEGLDYGGCRHERDRACWEAISDASTAWSRATPAGQALSRPVTTKVGGRLMPSSRQSASRARRALGGVGVQSQQRLTGWTGARQEFDTGTTAPSSRAAGTNRQEAAPSPSHQAGDADAAAIARRYALPSGCGGRSPPARADRAPGVTRPA